MHTFYVLNRPQYSLVLPLLTAVSLVNTIYDAESTTVLEGNDHVILVIAAFARCRKTAVEASN